MAEERRSARRADTSAVRVIYESATGDQVETDAHNIGPGGLFVRAAKPVAVGKRISLEMEVAGEAAPWSALGRVVWTRAEGDRTGRPAGMGVKLIDVEDSVVASIERLVEAASQAAAATERTAKPGPVEPPYPVAAQATESASRVPVVGSTARGRESARERTLLGVGLVSEPVIPAASPNTPAPVPVAHRDPMASQDAPKAEAPANREASVVAAPVPRRSTEGASDAEDEEEDEAAPASEGQAMPKPRAGGRWVLVLLVLALAGAAAYVILDGDVDRVLKPSDKLGGPPPAETPAMVAPTPSPTVVAAPPPSAAASHPNVATSPSFARPPLTPSATAAASAAPSPGAKSSPASTPHATPANGAPGANKKPGPEEKKPAGEDSAY